VARFCGKERAFRRQSARLAEIFWDWPRPDSSESHQTPRAAPNQPSQTVNLPVNPAPLRALATTIGELPDDEFTRLRDAVTWFAAHQESGLHARQVPVRGLDSKWVERHKKLLSGLLLALTGDGDLGLAGADPLLRLRFLDPSLAPGRALLDVSAPVAELNRLPVRPTTVYVFENLQCVLSMPETPGAVVVFGQGSAANLVAELSWLPDTPVRYWGDLDIDGFAILSRLRANLPVTSVMMDPDTLAAFRDLAVPDPNAGASRAVDNLTPAELEAFQALARDGLRLEQERIPWEHALAQLGATSPEPVANPPNNTP
jgi:hypothetical protein